MKGCRGRAPGQQLTAVLDPAGEVMSTMTLAARHSLLAIFTTRD
jgi:hypothetical protein